MAMFIFLDMEVHFAVAASRREVAVWRSILLIEEANSCGRGWHRFVDELRMSLRSVFPLHVVSSAVCPSLYVLVCGGERTSGRGIAVES